MNNLYLAFSVVFPLFFMMSLGYILKRLRVLNDAFIKELNQFCFLIFLPFILFSNIYKSDFFSIFSLKLILFALITAILLFFFLIFFISRIEKDNKKRSVMIQGIFRSNFILFGIPVTASLYGAQNISSTALLIAFMIPLFNLLSVVTLQYFSAQKLNLLRLTQSVLKNPLIIAAMIAFFFILTGIKLPAVIDKSISDVSQVATPLALIALGGSFTFTSLSHSFRQLSITVIGKLLILPLILIPISIFLGFRNIELTALMALFASPTAVSTYTMAQNSDADDILAGQIVVVSSLLSTITIFLFITILKSLTLI